jgi:hypothetical protein
VPDLSSLIARYAETEIRYGGLPIKLAYRPAEVTGEVQQVVAQCGFDPEPMWEQLEQVLVGWDLTQDGEPIPTTVAGFRRVGWGISLACMRGVLNDSVNPTWVPTPTVPIRSPNGSSPTETSATPPTTTPPSSTPNGAASHPGSSPTYPTPAALSAGVHGSVE